MRVALLMALVLALPIDQFRARTGPVTTTSTGGGSGGSGGGDLFNMDMTSGASTLAGFGGEASTEYAISINRSFQATGGQGSTPTRYQFTWLYDASQQSAGQGYGGEFYYGWSVDVGAAPSAGQSRFARFRVRLQSGANCRAIDSFDGTQPTTMRTKLMVLGDGAPGRTIVDIQCNADGANYELRLAQDGDTVGSVSGLSFGTWYNVQTRTVVGSGGSMAMWVNNDTVGSPNVSDSPRNMGAATYDFVGFGYYSNRMVTSTGVFVVDLADFEYATTFDSAWHTNAGS